MLPPTGKKSLTDENINNPTERSNTTVACEICGGIGWISANVPMGHPLFGKLIPCPHRQGEAERSKVQNLRRELGTFREMTFDNFLPEGRPGQQLTVQQRNSLSGAYQLLKRASLDQDLQKWFLIQGAYGCGKTHLAAATANACLNRNLSTIFVNVPDLLDYLRGAYSPAVEESYDERFNEVCNVQVLVLDDLGTQNATPWAEEKLFQILNARYVAKRPTIVTTNLELDDLDPRIRSRLSDQDLVQKIKIIAPDYRRGAGDEQIQSSLSTLGHYHDKRFDTFRLRSDLAHEEQVILKEAWQVAYDFAAGLQDWRFAKYNEKWLVFTGGYGAGKTHLAAAIANAQADQGYETMFVVVPDLLDHLRAAFSPDSRTSFDQRFEEVRATSLLVLDDLGTESATPWAREKLYQIINYRYVARIPTIITTTLSPKAFDQRIYTRISDESICKIVNINVTSFRGSLTPSDRQMDPGVQSARDKLQGLSSNAGQARLGRASQGTRQKSNQKGKRNKSL